MAASRSFVQISHQFRLLLSQRRSYSAAIYSVSKCRPVLRSPRRQAHRDQASINLQLARQFSSITRLLKSTDASSPSPSPILSEPTQYQYQEILSLTNSPCPKRILIDVREPAELMASGRIPGALNAPIKSSPDFPFVPAEEFEDRFGFPRPGNEDEVIFYCKSGVRSGAAARLAQQAGFGGKISEYRGSWNDWEAQGGPVEKGQ